MSVRHGEKAFLFVGSIIRWTLGLCQRVIAKISVKTLKGWKNRAVEMGLRICEEFGERLRENGDATAAMGAAKTSVRVRQGWKNYGGSGGRSGNRESA